MAPRQFVTLNNGKMSGGVDVTFAAGLKKTGHPRCLSHPRGVGRLRAGVAHDYGGSKSYIAARKGAVMCRNIRPLFNFEPPASEEEIRASALQFVRKVSGFTKPSQANAEAFERAVDEVADTARKLIFSLHSAAPPRDRETEAHKARERSRLRYG
jgi:hypothetical protein